MLQVQQIKGTYYPQHVHHEPSKSLNVLTNSINVKHAFFAATLVQTISNNNNKTVTITCASALLILIGSNMADKMAEGRRKWLNRWIFCLIFIRISVTWILLLFSIINLFLRFNKILTCFLRSFMNIIEEWSIYFYGTTKYWTYAGLLICWLLHNS